jgi:hypothetical protein
VDAAPDRLVRLYRALVGFAFVLGCYWIYCLVAVPLIEPPSVSVSPQGVSAQEAAQAEKRFQEYRERLLPLFPEGGWDLAKTKIIETEDTIVLLEEYDRPDELHLRVWPCAGVLAAERNPETSAILSAIVIEAPEGALLEFDAPVDLRRGQIRRPKRIQLRGPVRLRQYTRGANPDELLLVETRQVEVEEERVWSQEEVQFRFGPHFGKGRGLRVELGQMPRRAERASPQSARTAVREIEVSRVERLHVVLPGQRRGNRKSVPAGESIIFELACDGPFRFEPSALRASFEGNVRGWRSGPGAADELRCEELIFWLAGRSPPLLGGSSAQEATSSSVPEATEMESGANSVRQRDLGGVRAASFSAATGEEEAPAAEAIGRAEVVAGWEIRRLQMRGAPAIVRAPSWQFAFEGNLLEYDLVSGDYFLGGEGSTAVRYGGVRITAANLRGRLPFESLGTDWNQAEAELSGPGSLSHALRADAPPQIVARWNDRLWIRPHEGRQVLSLLQGAEIIWQGVGRLRAEEVHIWLVSPASASPRQVPKEMDPLESLAPQPAEEKPSDSIGTFVQIGGLRPERVLARQQVRIDSAQALVSAKELRVMFEYPGDGTVGVPRPAGATLYPVKAGSLGFCHLVAKHERGDLFGRQGGEGLGGIRSAIGKGTTCGAACSGAAWIPVCYQMPSEAGDSDGAASGVGGFSRANLPGVSEIPRGDPAGDRPAASSPVGERGVEGSRFEVSTELLQVRLRAGEAGFQCADALLEGNVQVVEKLGQESDNIRPALLTGRSVYVADPGTVYWSVLVTGDPGHVEARGLSLTAGRIAVNAGSNRLWVDQPGRLEVWFGPDQLQAAGEGAAVPLVVRWGGSLLFDGQFARLEGGVQAGLADGQLQTQDLDLALVEPIRFGELAGGVQPALRQIGCHGPTVLSRAEGGVRPPGQAPLAAEQLEVVDLQLDWQSGEFEANGPGRAVARRPATSRLAGIRKDSFPGDEQRGGSAAPEEKGDISAGVSQIGPETGAPPAILVLRFAQSLKGNLWSRRGTVRGHVRAIYLPQWPWSWVPDPDQPGEPPPGAVRITCGTLTAVELAPPGFPRSWELIAEENVWLEGNGFTGRAPRLSYAQGKDLLVLEGTPRNPAELFRQQAPGEPAISQAATRILLWPSTKRLVVEGLQTLQVP